MFYFYTPWKFQKTLGFLMFSGGIEMKHWLEKTKPEKTFNNCIHTRALKKFTEFKADVWNINISIYFVYPMPE